MSTKTQNYGLTKPASTDFYDIEVFNTNAEIIDKALEEKAGLANAALSGVPTAPTAVQGSETEQIANTEFVTNAIANAVSSTYKAAGSYAFASLPSPGKANLGSVYNITDSFTTTSAFLEGAGDTYPVGTNVVVIYNGTNYLYDVLGGFIDMSLYATVEKMGVLASLTTTDKSTIVAAINEAISNIAATVGLVAPIYSPTGTYTIDSYCIYGMKLYKCSTAITTAEAFTASHWTATTIMAEITAINGNIATAYTPVITFNSGSANLTINSCRYIMRGHTIKLFVDLIIISVAANTQMVFSLPAGVTSNIVGGIACHLADDAFFFQGSAIFEFYTAMTSQHVLASGEGYFYVDG